MIRPDFSPVIRRYEVLESTNKTAKELAMNGEAEGTVVLAKRQTQGRGRGARVWHSPEGGLYLSVLLRPGGIGRQTDLALLAGVALAQAVKTLLPKAKEISVKWPNDCLVGGKKVGGVLCETAGSEDFPMAIVGIGLNVNVADAELEAFKGNPFSATSFLVEGGEGPFDEELALETLLRKLFGVYYLYRTEGFVPVQFLWEKNCGYIGKKLELRETGHREQVPGTYVPRPIVGTFLGIDEKGALVLSVGGGERRTFVTGEIVCFLP